MFDSIIYIIIYFAILVFVILTVYLIILNIYHKENKNRSLTSFDSLIINEENRLQIINEKESWMEFNCILDGKDVKEELIRLHKLENKSYRNQ